MTRLIRDIYSTTSEFVRTFGAFQLFFVRLLRHSPAMFVTRFGLVVRQVYNTGALSLVIIMVCGLFVGGVLGLILGMMIYSEWPESSAWVIGTLVGIHLIFEGWAMIALSSAVRRSAGDLEEVVEQTAPSTSEREAS